jgi:hypothetical protein
MRRNPALLAALLALLPAVAAGQEGAGAPPREPPPAQGDAPAAAPPAAETPPATAPLPPAETPRPQRPGTRPVPRGAVLEEVAGTLRGVDRKTHRLTIDTPAGPVGLGIDRNTMVYTGAGLGTVRDLSPGVQIRAGRNAEYLAYWVQIRPAPGTPTSTPAQGTGPGGGAGPPAEGASPAGPVGGGAGPTPGGPPGGGSVTPGGGGGASPPGQ